MMTQDEVEDVIEEQRHAVDSLGMIDFEHYLRFKVNAQLGMIDFGDKFIKSLGFALQHACLKDAIKIIHVWKNICSQHEMMYRAKIAKEAANKYSDYLENKNLKDT